MGWRLLVVGPNAAARQALALARVRVEGDHVSWVAEAGGCLLRPLEAPWGVVSRFLHDA